MGTIISQDSKEVLINTKDKGEVSIPKYQIKEMKELESGQLDKSGNLVIKEIFSTRYFLTTNGLPLEKGDNYAQINWFGPEFHLGVAKNFNIGVITSWLGAPIVVAAKKTIPLGEFAHLGIGGLAGTSSWASFGGNRWNFALPFGALTVGNTKSNFNISYGYGMSKFSYSSNTNTANVLSIAFMSSVSDKVKLVFDSMILLEQGAGFLTPGVRIQSEERKAFQFGFLFFSNNGQFSQIPFPMITWYRQI